MDILKKIVRHKLEEINSSKQLIPLDGLKEIPTFQRSPISISKILEVDHNPGIIAEFKRRSPSKPSINLDAEVNKIVPAYQEAGASAISVLTDKHFFGGSLYDLKEARALVNIPLLRKDFIVDTYQVIEAKAFGADFILLIAEILSSEQITELSNLAHDLGLEVLLEMHSIDQLKKLSPSVDVLGVNNRNLKTFSTDINFSLDQYDALPKNKLKISESGIHHVEDIKLLRNRGYNGFLIGEQFMKSEQAGEACNRFISAIKN